MPTLSELIRVNSRYMNQEQQLAIYWSTTARSATAISFQPDIGDYGLPAQYSDRRASVLVNVSSTCPFLIGGHLGQGEKE